MPLPNKVKPLTPVGKINPQLLEELVRQSTSSAYDPTPAYLSSFARNFTPTGNIIGGAIDFGRQAGDMLSKTSETNQIAPLSDWLKLLGMASTTSGVAGMLKNKTGTAISDFLAKRLK